MDCGRAWSSPEEPGLKSQTKRRGLNLRRTASYIYIYIYVYLYIYIYIHVYMYV